MLEQKQIEEMSEDIARILCEIYRPNCDEYEPHSCSNCYVNSTPIGCFVEMLYNAGYRKQREIVGEIFVEIDDAIDNLRGAFLRQRIAEIKREYGVIANDSWRKN